MLVVVLLFSLFMQLSSVVHAVDVDNDLLHIISQSQSKDINLRMVQHEYDILANTWTIQLVSAVVPLLVINGGYEGEGGTLADEISYTDKLKSLSSMVNRIVTSSDTEDVKCILSVPGFCVVTVGDAKEKIVDFLGKDNLKNFASGIDGFSNAYDKRFIDKVYFNMHFDWDVSAIARVMALNSNLNSQKDKFLVDMQIRKQEVTANVMQIIIKINSLVKKIEIVSDLLMKVEILVADLVFNKRFVLLIDDYETSDIVFLVLDLLTYLHDFQSQVAYFRDEYKTITGEDGYDLPELPKLFIFKSFADVESLVSQSLFVRKQQYEIDILRSNIQLSKINFAKDMMKIYGEVTLGWDVTHSKGYLDYLFGVSISLDVLREVSLATKYYARELEMEDKKFRNSISVKHLKTMVFDGWNKLKHTESIQTFYKKKLLISGQLLFRKEQEISTGRVDLKALSKCLRDYYDDNIRFLDNESTMQILSVELLSKIGILDVGSLSQN